MPLDDDPDWAAAFAELHRRAGEQAPPFAAMRERALRRAVRPAFRWPWWLRWAPVAACAVAVLWIAHPPAPLPPRASSTQHVEQLLTAIEQHLALDAAISPTFPSDVLHTQNPSDSIP